MTKINISVTLILLLFITSCATYSPKYKEETVPLTDTIADRELDKTFFLIGDAGGAKVGETTNTLKALKKYTDSTGSKGDYAIFLGDNIYDSGLPPKDASHRKEAEHRLDVQIEALKDFKGRVLFIPGNHDWYDDGLVGLKRQEEYIEDALNDNESFQPENGCPIENIEVSENIELLVLDTQWYISDWDKHPTMNDECDINSREDFFLEIEGELKKNNGKTIVIAMHHPAYTNGIHGGVYNFQKHIFSTKRKIPLPILGSLVTQIRSQGGVSPQDRYNLRYNELMKRLITMSKSSDKVVFASGHEHNLQYIESEGVKQIVSGSGSKRSAANLGQNGLFSYGGEGFAVLNVFKDGSSEVNFYGAQNGTPNLMFSKNVYEKTPDYDTSLLAEEFGVSREVSVYKKEDTEKSDSYKWFWGDHYRDVYGTNVLVPVATIDTLMGGFTVERKGGGHQTRSLRLIDSRKRNFALRAVKKSATQFLQKAVFKDIYVEDEFEKTITEDVLLDFYTSSHPFATFTIGTLADAIGVYHTNPMMFYMPKHKALGNYNDEFGDELYIIEERPDDGFVDVPSFGSPDGIDSTSDVLENLRKDEKYKIDEPAYIKARLFDMLLGDWDRHQDQWRWSRFDISDDESVYRPIPRDRDQVFSNYDGALLGIIQALVPTTRAFQVYDGDLKNVKWINFSGIKLDRTFTQNTGRDVWLAQAKYIQEHLTDEAIDEAFSKLPIEVQGETSRDISDKLKERRGNIVAIAEEYYNHLSKQVIITGTDKDDFFEITRGDKTTTITVSRIKGGEVKKPFKKRVINASETNEIWVYGLDDDDEFLVNGSGKKPIFTRIIGGQNNDVYTMENGKKIKVYDHKTKPNTIVKKGSASFRFNNIYDNNTYDYNRYISAVNTIVPSVGYNPDDGVKLGIQDVYMTKGFKSDPYESKHTLSLGYFLATEGLDLQYTGEFAKAFGKWNVIVSGRYANESFTQNYFGLGNDTKNFDDDLEMDYNRVKTGIYGGHIGLVKTGHYGSRIAITTGVDKIEVQQTEGRFIASVLPADSKLFESNFFGNVDLDYSYSGSDSKAFPTRGMYFGLRVGATTNLEETKNTFGYIHPSLEFINALSRNRKLVLKTKVQGQFKLGNKFEFYQAAVLGANTGLRGYRTQRFAGNSALAFNADINYKLIQFKTGLLPLQMSLFGGYDVGRVWLKGEDSNTWHTDFGGGLVINAVDTVSGEFGLFGGKEGPRFAFGFLVSL
ncbi:metallophosphoesterase [Ulvibacter litoralis]|uniref:Surface antigen n=1 Tax=Ulvibacter litoralis TaxID=227084 RepID=A0A1G7HLZ2_9FLAO|nr:metallophosphoesterase [Ulvibacter litoralis]GHC58310.1 hypothetical protein GCM10008083_23790 [Ulvibacter litoralis]SDF01373.1 Surface antigen [Ulvibacter litoralis]